MKNSEPFYVQIQKCDLALYDKLGEWLHFVLPRYYSYHYLHDQHHVVDNMYQLLCISLFQCR